MLLLSISLSPLAMKLIVDEPVDVDSLIQDLAFKKKRK